jgi:hypothetical protein
VEDALGNTDTVKISLKKELNEKNLYGTEPQGDLDLRFVRRTDTNLAVGEAPKWLGNYP